MENRVKKYVEVVAIHHSDGTCRPSSITLDDETFEIDRVRQSCRAASTKVGGTGIRYTIVINGIETFLFDEGNGKWFVESKA